MQLRGWRSILFRLGLLGQDPARYDGAAYGNVSARIGPFPSERGARPFVVSATQTGGLALINDDSFAVVTSWDMKRNRVISRGPALPSSASMTHGAVYDVSPTIRAVLHVHTPSIFSAARVLASGPAVLEQPTPVPARVCNHAPSLVGARQCWTGRGSDAVSPSRRGRVRVVAVG